MTGDNAAGEVKTRTVLVVEWEGKSGRSSDRGRRRVKVEVIGG